MKIERKRLSLISQRKNLQSLCQREPLCSGPSSERHKLDSSSNRDAYAQDHRQRKEEDPCQPSTSSATTSQNLKQNTNSKVSDSFSGAKSSKTTPNPSIKRAESPYRRVSSPSKKAGLLRSAGFLKTTKRKPKSPSPVTIKSGSSSPKEIKDDKKSTESPQPGTSDSTALKKNIPNVAPDNNEAPNKKDTEASDKNLPDKVSPVRVRFNINDEDRSKSSEVTDRETGSRTRQVPIHLSKSNFYNYDEDLISAVITRQPRSRFQRQSTYPTDNRTTYPISCDTYGSRITEESYYAPRPSELYFLHGNRANLNRVRRKRRSLPSIVQRTDSCLNLACDAIGYRANQHYEYIEEFHTGPTVNEQCYDYDSYSSVNVPLGTRQESPSVHQPLRFNRLRRKSVPLRIDNITTPQTPEHSSTPQRGDRSATPRERTRRPSTVEDHQRLSYDRQRYGGTRRAASKNILQSDSDEESQDIIRERPSLSISPTDFTYTPSCEDLPSQINYSYIGPQKQVLQGKIFVPATTYFGSHHTISTTHYPGILRKEVMNSLEDHERKIIIEFCHLLEKSKQLFNGLRELPQYGHKQWSLYFGRTFDIYTRLWKYQQQHRAILDSKYGMKRWQIGEIASKIGQLYYHFYLRTSETAYLNEAFSFYFAIRGRCYYTKANKEDKCELMVKKLRYYARFIVVCLLQNKMKLVKELIKELERQIIEYGNTYDPDDQVEWAVVVDEIKAFVHAEPIVSVVSHDNQTMILTHRLTPITTPPLERTSQMNLTLQEILIVGSSSQQVKFSELTMDMFRILQIFEREQPGDIQHIYDESPRQRFMSTPNAPNQDGLEPSPKQPNPHKYLLFKPSPGQVMVYLASACYDMPTGGALLLYVSADGHVPQLAKHAEDDYEMGGLITSSKADIYRDCNKESKSSTSTGAKYKDQQCLYPGDLYPYTRRPLYIIIDSDNSYAFQNIPRHFGQPLVILMSPLDMPPCYHDPRRGGSMFTLFLQSPLEGLCYICDLSSVPYSVWNRAGVLIEQFMAEASTIFVRSRLVEPTYITFFGDDFLRTLTLRYVFCEATLRLHRLFRGRTHRTRCSPVMPDELFEHPTLVHIIMDIANLLQVRNHIQDPTTANRDAAPAGPAGN